MKITAKLYDDKNGEVGEVVIELDIGVCNLNKEIRELREIIEYMKAFEPIKTWIEEYDKEIEYFLEYIRGPKR